MSQDPITLAVIKGRIEQIVDEMDLVLVTSAFSPQICEGYDRANGIYDPENGNTIAQGKLGLPIFIGCMEFATRSVINKVKSGEKVSVGDVFIMNDPFLGGTHLMDVKLIKPYFYNNELIFYLACTGHWIDIGGSTPGGFRPKATEIYQEGIRIPPIRLYRDGKLVEDIFDFIFLNNRVPEAIKGDLMAQVNALNVGESRLNELFDKYGKKEVLTCIGELEEKAEKYIRSYIKEIPDGIYSFADYMDNDGIERKPLKISLDLVINGSDMFFDFSRTCQSCKGPLNLSISTTTSACFIAIKHIFPEIPINSGFFKPFKFNIPKGTLLNADAPLPVGGYTETSQRVIDVVFGALAKAIPEKLFGAPFSTTTAFIMSGGNPSKGYYILPIYYAGGYGGSKSSDGLTGGNPPYSMASFPPVEIYESRYPIMYQKFALNEGSGGAGKYRGGLGAIYEFKLMDEKAIGSILGDRGKYAPFGICGGKAGGRNEVCFFQKHKKYKPRFGIKDEGILFKKGDIIQLKTPGGGGYGNPFERDSQLVLEDIKLGYISEKIANEIYGVFLGKDGKINFKKTNRRIKKGIG